MAATTSALDIPVGRLLAFGAGGVGLSALENQYIGQNLPEPLKKINLGLGASTGIMMASRNPAMQIAGLGTLPLKQIGLFATGGMDRFRRQQQSLVDTNLATAKINEGTALQEGHNAGSKRLMELMFLVPALAAGGAMGYNALEQWRKRHTKPNRFATTGSAGVRKPSQRVRIDLPPSALPSSFYQALADSETNPRGYTRLQTKTATYLRKSASGWSQNFQAAHPTLGLFNQQQPPSRVHQALSLLKDIAWQSSGIPAAGNAFRDAGQTFDSMNTGDYGSAARYGASGVGNAALAALAVRFGGFNVLGKLFGKARLGGVVHNQMAAEAKGLGRFTTKSEWGRQMTEMPTFAKHIANKGFGDELGPMHLSTAAPARGLAGADGYISGANRFTRRGQIAGAKGFGSSYMRSPERRALDMHGRYDPQRYAWHNPTVDSGIFKGVLAAGGGTGARSLPGHIADIPRYLGNRAVNAGYWTKQFAKRHPVATGWTALPILGGTGVVADDLQREQDKAQPRPWLPDPSYSPPSSTTFMPPSAIAGNLLGSFGGQGGIMSPLQKQFAH